MAGVHVPQMQRKDEDPLSAVMKGLQIAESVYGIKVSRDKLAAAEQAKKDEARGLRTPEQIAELQKTHDLSDSPVTGSVQMYKRDAEGKESPFWATVRGKTPEKPQMGTYTDAKGNKREGKRGDSGFVVQNLDSDPIIEPFRPGAPKEDKTPANTMDLRKEYNAHPVTKATGELTSAYKKVESTATTKTPSGASDMSLVYGYIKMLDPGTGIKEGEYAQAGQTGGIPDWVVNLYNKAKDGQKLTPEQRANFLAEARSLLSEQLSLQAEQDARYSELASAFNLKPSQVIDPTWAKIRQSLAGAGRAPAPQSSGEAYAAPQGVAIEPTVDEIEAELKRREALQKQGGSSPKGGFGGRGF